MVVQAHVLQAWEDQDWRERLLRAADQPEGDSGSDAAFRIGCEGCGSDHLYYAGLQKLHSLEQDREISISIYDPEQEDGV